MADTSDCLFCRLARGEIPATILRQTDRTVTFRDIDPQAPTHVLVIPREHHADVGALAAVDPALLGEVVSEAAQAAVDEGLDGYRLVFNTGTRAGQSVFHVHGHVLGGRPLSWPPG